VARRHGDYAVCGVGALVTLDADERVESAQVGLISMGPTPVVLDVSEAVTGQPHDAVDADAAGRLVTDAVDPDADIHATAEYRRHLSGTLTARAVTTAAARAGGRPR
jgi:aerobic carbon-monoxide dehydrogenase medium subunit